MTKTIIYFDQKAKSLYWGKLKCLGIFITVSCHSESRYNENVCNVKKKKKISNALNLNLLLCPNTQIHLESEMK